MKQVPVGIIGGTGGIGRWFACWFESKGYPVYVSGRNSGLSAREMTERCPVVIISVPIRSTVAVIGEVGPLMKRESLLMDFTSLKAEPVRAMLECSKSEVIGLHPLFGPGANSLAGQNIAVCPGRGQVWGPMVRKAFEQDGARLIETTPERHDEVMAVVQALTHINTAVMARAVSAAGIPREELDLFSTPFFRDRMRAVDSVVSHPGLYADLIRGNTGSMHMAEICKKAISGLKAALEQGDAEELQRFIAGDVKR